MAPPRNTNKNNAAQSSFLWANNKGFLVAVSCVALVAYFYFLGMEGKEGTIQLVDVEEKTTTTTTSHTTYESKKPPAVLRATPAPPTSTPPVTKPSSVQTTTTAPTPKVVTPVLKPSLSTNNDKKSKASNDSFASNLLQKLKKAKTTMYQQLEADYGPDNFSKMFRSAEGVTVGRTLFLPHSAVSWDRLKRKLQQKVLQTTRKSSPVRFIWATGGHSSTAGHGNYYRESYTAVLERTIQEVFAAVDLEFEGRNYAMGGTDSGPETAWCVDSIYGNPDLLVWDHGMTDGSDYEKTVLYLYRAAKNRNLPICLANHLGKRMQIQVSDIFHDLEAKGLGLLYADEAVYTDMVAAVPDSLGKTQEEIDAMPLFVRNFKCGKQWEAGDPYCGAEKYNETFCSERRFKTSWHQGWKWHAMQGHTLAMVLVEVLEDAIRELQASEIDPEALLEMLGNQERDDNTRFLGAALPDITKNLFENKTVADEIDLNAIYKAPAFCHTAKVPAQIRFKGILTDSEPGDVFHFPEGITLKEAIMNENDSEFLRLVQHADTRQKCDEVVLNVDHKDFFFVSEAEGWKKLSLPTDAEIVEYGTTQPLAGYLSICFTQCPWGKCEEGMLSLEDLVAGKAEVQVNGKPVLETTKIKGCSMLKGPQGYIWPVSEESSKFEIGFKVNEKGSNLRVGAAVIIVTDSKPIDDSASLLSPTKPAATTETVPEPDSVNPVEKRQAGHNIPGPATVDEMIKNLHDAKQDMISTLHRDYGTNNYASMFMSTTSDGVPVSRGRTLFQSPGREGDVSWKRMMRKLQQKVLQVLIQANGAPSSKPGLLSSFRKTASTTTEKKPVRFVWATGGHSSTAGHGNYYDESYTAVLEQTIKPAFASIGIDFEGRNYAMGGTDSAPETALCIDSIFGANDPDVLVWDHGMTDGNNNEKIALYFYRAAVNRNRPIGIANHVGKRAERSKGEVLQYLEDNGLGILMSVDKEYEAVIDAVPDSLGLTDEEIHEMPPFIRNFKCGKQWEAGDPYCGTEKYNETFCTERRYKAGWHQGWKWHAMQGKLAALFLVEVLEDALSELQKGTSDPANLLNLLVEQEKDDQKRFFNGNLPEVAPRILKEASFADEIDLGTIFKQPCFCHTAKLPAEIRHQGILMQSPPGDLYNFTEGITIAEAEAGDNPSSYMHLVQEAVSRQNCKEVALNLDHKDFFFVSEKDGWKAIAFPNNAEIAEYGTGEPMKGLVVVCFTQCPWGKCPPGMLKVDDFKAGKGEIKVNGEPVTGFAQSGEECHFLKGAQGFTWPFAGTAPTPGKLELSFLAAEAGSKILVGSVVVF